MSCYGRDIVEATSKKMNLPVSKISEHEETYSTSLFPMLLPLGSDSIAKQDEIYNVQKEVIRHDQIRKNNRATMNIITANVQ